MALLRGGGRGATGGGRPAAQANNQLNGTLPAGYSNLVSLTSLRLGSNSVGGAPRAARLLLAIAVGVSWMYFVGV